jgi:hypothetical protein
MEEFELASNSVSGLSARISFNWLTKNLPLTKDIEQFQDDWQTLTEVAAAVAARHVLECGTWAPKSEEEMSKIATDFLSGGDTSDLSDYDEGLLSLMQNDFTSSIPFAAQAAVRLSIWRHGHGTPLPQLQNAITAHAVISYSAFFIQLPCVVGALRTARALKRSSFLVAGPSYSEYKPRRQKPLEAPLVARALQPHARGKTSNKTHSASGGSSRGSSRTAQRALSA